jgi:hypothetical protein
MLGRDERVFREFWNPTFLSEVRHLASRVQAAAERAAGQGLRSWPDWLKGYAVEEIWCFRLARDLTVWLATLDGVSGERWRSSSGSRSAIGAPSKERGQRRGRPESAPARAARPPRRRSGIGRDEVRKLAGEGAQVVVVYCHDTT